MKNMNHPKDQAIVLHLFFENYKNCYMRTKIETHYLHYSCLEQRVKQEKQEKQLEDYDLDKKEI